ncbi:MAG TPA: hypothetical protein VLT45_12620, partial [Kofleriaceae bacterium]|nr:hypothetical protein [Kofleriaceae bacterium]
MPLERGPDLARAICAVTGEADDRPQVWQTTADRVASGRPVAGYSTLRQHWPDLAGIIDTALPADGGAQAARDHLDAIGIPTAVPATHAAATIRQAIENARLGFTVLRVTEGAGKTQAAAEVAIARARSAPAKPRSMDRTLIVTDKHAVAERLVSRLRDAGVHGEYWRSVLSVRDLDGNPSCEYFVPVAALARGRQSAIATFCDGIGMGHKGDEPCPRRPICPAYQSATVAVNAAPGSRPAVVITVHAKLGEALAWAGESALVLIDEDPRAVEAHTLTREQLEAATRLDASFTSSESWRSVVARALAAGLSNATPGETAADTLTRGCAILSHVGEWRDAAERIYGTTDAGTIARAFAIRAAYRKTADGSWQRKASFAPKLHPRERARVFARGAMHPSLADASLVHAVLAQAFAGAMKATPDGANEHKQEAILVVDRGDAAGAEPVLRALISSTAVSEALRRYGQTVLLDATANIAALEAIAGHDSPATEIRVAEGNPIDRRLLYYSGATRRKV